MKPFSVVSWMYLPWAAQFSESIWKSCLLRKTAWVQTLGKSLTNSSHFNRDVYCSLNIHKLPTFTYTFPEMCDHMTSSMKWVVNVEKFIMLCTQQLCTPLPDTLLPNCSLCVPTHCRQHYHWAQSWTPEPESRPLEEPYQYTLTPEAVVFVYRKHCSCEPSTHTTWVVHSRKSITHTSQIMHVLLDWCKWGGVMGAS